MTYSLKIFCVKGGPTQNLKIRKKYFELCKIVQLHLAKKPNNSMEALKEDCLGNRILRLFELSCYIASACIVSKKLVLRFLGFKEDEGKLKNMSSILIKFDIE